MTSPSRPKPITRRTVLARRDALAPAERGAASAQIAERARPLLDALAPGEVVALYAPKGTEVDTAALDAHARSRGLRVAYPRIVADARRLAFHEVTIEQLVASRFGLREPLPTSPDVALDALRAIVVPGLAFDREGGRVGWGRGHYDATLVASRALRVGLAFECQLVERVPRDPHDVLLDRVVTEAAVYGGAP